MLSWRPVLHFVAARGSSQCLHSCNIFCIKNYFGATRQQPHCQWVQWSREGRWVWQKKGWSCQATALHSSSGIFRIIFLAFIFGFLKEKPFACLEPLLLSLWRLCCFSCSTTCQAMHEISQLPQGWQSLGRPDSTVQISRDFELFSASFKDHPVIPLYRFWSRFSSCNFLSQEQKSTLILSHKQEQEDSSFQWCNDNYEFRAPGFRNGSPKEAYLVVFSDSKRQDPLPLILSYF